MTRFVHRHLPAEIQDFIATFPTESKIEIQDYERYENTYEVIYRVDKPELGRVTRTAYIRVQKDRMSDSEAIE